MYLHSHGCSNKGQVFAIFFISFFVKLDLSNNTVNNMRYYIGAIVTIVLMTQDYNVKNWLCGPKHVDMWPRFCILSRTAWVHCVKISLNINKMI